MNRNQQNQKLFDRRHLSKTQKEKNEKNKEIMKKKKVSEIVQNT